MTKKLGDLIRQTTETEGVGAIALIDPEQGYFGFVDVLGDGAQTFYVINDGLGNVEGGWGTLTAGSPDSLSRDTVVFSSNSGSLVNFNSGIKTVICAIAAENIVWSGNTPSAGDFPQYNGTEWLFGNISAALSPANATITISPTGTGKLVSNGTATGNLDNLILGATVPKAATVTDLTATGNVTLSGGNKTITISPTGTGTLTVNPATAGTINNVAIGGITRAAGNFTTISANGSITAADASVWSSTGIALTATLNCLKGSTFAGSQSAFVAFAGASTATAYASYQASTASRTHITFENGNGLVGSIVTAASATAFNTSSDYRLKTDAVALDGKSAIMGLSPYAFTWKAGGNRDAGMFAHEVQACIPNAVHGDKDAMQDIGELINADGSIAHPSTAKPLPEEMLEGQTWEKTGSRPVYQQVDYSKIVPYLVAHCQDLERRLAALGG